MERARWNTELLYKKLNCVICPTFWGHINSRPLFILLIPTLCNNKQWENGSKTISALSYR
jgi:hypothetical protein